MYYIIYRLLKKSKFTINYLKNLISIEKKCKSFEWKYSEQSLANNYMKQLNYTHVLSLSINIFMDGYNFFNRINYLYNSSSNYLNLIGFHNDYTFGIVSKTYRMKELGLYILDENEYYSSITNKYIYFSSIIEYNTSRNEIFLSTYIHISKRINRILIFPRFKCSINKYCTFVRVYNLEYFEKTCVMGYRENSFLFSKRIPNEILTKSAIIASINFNNISNLIKYKNQLLIIENVENFNFNYIKCFRKDNWWQRNFK